MLRIGAVLILGAVLAQLDTTIVGVGMGPMARDLRVPVTTVQWVSTGYLLTVAFTAPLSGWLHRRFGGKRVWLSAVALFVVASALSAVAWSGGSLIAFRLLQGVGGGLMQPVGQALVARHAGPRRIGRLIGVITVPVSVAPVLGPVIGGALLQCADWRWLFLVNVPVGAVALLLAARVVPADGAERDSGARPDLLGLALLPTGLAAVVYGLGEAATGGAAGPRILVPAAGAALLTAYVVHALRTRRPPLLDVRLFAGRGFALAGINTFLLGAALYSSMMLFPLYFMDLDHVSALDAGLLLAPQALGSALATPKAGGWTDRHGPRKVVLAGIALTLCGTLPFAMATSARPPELLLAVALFVRGLGLGAVVPPNVAATYTSVDRSQAPAATSARTVLNRIGGSVGTAVLALILQNSLHHAGTHAAPRAAYAHTFWWALVFSALTLVPAALYPRRSPAAR
ncbi:MFS transporter [Streptomyces sp. ICBB 8177]|nr:MFS transporter [Streptomyces sp. ICBB 8177]